MWIIYRRSFKDMSPESKTNLAPSAYKWNLNNAGGAEACLPCRILAKCDKLLKYSGSVQAWQWTAVVTGLENIEKGKYSQTLQARTLSISRQQNKTK